jgi:hypothetical protein
MIKGPADVHPILKAMGEQQWSASRATMVWSKLNEGIAMVAA